MVKKIIHNPRPPDNNFVRTTSPVTPASLEHPVIPNYTPEYFLQSDLDVEVLKWALQFYIYQEKNQKISGKTFLSEITEDKRNIAVKLLQKLI